MAKISLKRQREIAVDAPQVRRIYEAACRQFGQDKVHADLSRIWDQRCMWGIKNVLPFGALESKNIGEVLWVAENVCGIQRTPR